MLRTKNVVHQFSRQHMSFNLLRFKRFGAEDYAKYKRCYNQIEPASDFSLNNVIVWFDINNDLSVAYDHNNVVLRYSCPFLGNKLVFSIIGVNSPAKTIRKVFEYQQANSLR